MNGRLRKPAAVLIALAGFLLFGTRLCFAESLGSAVAEINLDMWHYSGGYWIIGNSGSTKFKVTDAEMAARGMDGIMGDAPVSLSAELPLAAKKALDEGKEIQVKAFGSNAGLGKIFLEDSCETVIDGGQVIFSGVPRFNLIPESTLSFRDYGIATNVSVPLIDNAYGCNIYAIYGSGYSGAQAFGWLDADDPFDASGLPQGRLHPGMIQSASGQIAAGSELSLRGLLVPSSGLNVGSGTFKNGGAVGVSFVFRVKFGFATPEEVIEEEDVEEPEEPEVWGPSVDASVGGMQKANRKQLLNVSLTYNKRRPIREMYAELCDGESGEKIRLYLDKEAATGAGFYTRRFESKEGMTEGYMFAQLPFLTKNTERQVYSYTVYAKDSMGREDSVSGNFTVEPDLPPSAAISMAESFFRNEGSNIADITASDASESDGDRLSCSWEPPAEAEDFGYVIAGSDHAVEFRKRGVGYFDLGLTVTEVWGDEETLPEYVTAEDHLSSSCTASAKVDNRPPVVGVDLQGTKSAELLLLCDSRENYDYALSKEAELSSALLGEGIHAAIHSALISPEGTPNGSVSIGQEISVPFGFSAGWKAFWEQGSTAADELNIYKLEASWVQTANYSIDPCAPYTLHAYRREDQTELWRTVLTAAELPGANSSVSAAFASNEEGGYLYLICAGRTLLFDRQTGALSGSFPASLGRYNVLSGKYVYSFKSDGIYRLNLSSGSFSRIINTPVLMQEDKGIRQLAGRCIFVTKRGGKLYKASFNAENAEIGYTLLAGTENDLSTASSSFICIDSRGHIIVNTGGTCRVWNSDCRQLSSVNISTKGYINPVLDSAGNCNYLAWSESYTSGENYCCRAYVYGLSSGYSSGTVYSDSNGFPCNPNQFVFGMELPNGDVYTAYGATWSYIANITYYGYNNGPSHGMPERLKITRFTPGTSAPGANASLPAGGLANTIEFGIQLPGAVLLNTGDNNYYQSMAKNSTRMLSFTESREASVKRQQERYLSYETDYSFCRFVSGAFDPSTLASDLTEETGNGVRSLFIERLSSGGAVSKAVELRDSETYYYEYDSSVGQDLLRVDGAISSSAAGEAYRVSSCYFEDFSTDRLNPFFSYNSGSRSANSWQLVYLNFNGKSRSVGSGSGNIGFTVPAGKKAVLSFDYAIQDASGSNLSSFFSSSFYLTKDGGAADYWSVFKNGSHSGHYTHKTLLEPGEYKLVASAQAYGYQSTGFMRVDNLAVCFVEPASGAGASGSSGIAQESTVFETADGYHVSGSFKTPGRIASFAKLESIRAGEGNSMISHETGDGYEKMTFDLPEDKAALYMSVKVEAEPIALHLYDYVSERWPTQYKNTGFKWNDKSWTKFGSPTNTQKFQDSPTGTYTIGACGLSGVQSFSSNFKYSQAQTNRYRAATGYGKGYFSEPQVFFAANPNAVPQAVKDNDFFIAGGELYYPSGGFQSSARLSLSAQAPEDGEDPDAPLRISNLKIYYLDEGEKVYLENSSLKAGSAADSWDGEGARAYLDLYLPEEEETAPMIYKKGEYINYNISYQDPENDPSLRQVWYYTHTPMNDGLFELDRIELSQPVHTFYQDGKYVLQHYQVDDAHRNGLEGEFCKPSNIFTLTFYIEGGQGPMVRYIRTDPAEVEAATEYALSVSVKDADKDELTLYLELYYENQEIYSAVRSGLLPDYDGNYPVQYFPDLPLPEIGTYDVIARVWDGTSWGMGSLRFKVKEPGIDPGSMKLHRLF